MIKKSKKDFEIPALLRLWSQTNLDTPALLRLSPRSTTAALKADMILRALFDEMERKPGDNKLESHVATIMKSHHVSRASVFRALDQLGPERRKRMEQDAVTMRALRSRLSSLTK
jgi:hypothetical protein